jgi:hypothetical protein
MSRPEWAATITIAVGCTLALVIALGGASAAAAQDDERLALGRALADLIVDEDARRSVDEQVSTAMLRAIGATLQERLNRNLQETEVRTLAGLVERFVNDSVPSNRAVEIAARSYARHFDEAELRELVRFQRSETGRKAARLTTVIAAETAQAIYVEVRESPLMPRLLAELQRDFPVLRPSESP